MSDEEFLVQLRQAFVVEAREHLEAITAGLLRLERGPGIKKSVEVVENTFREAHSLKGAARAVARTDIESLCQEMESIFAHWKDHAPKVTSVQFDLLNQTVDLLARLIPLRETAQAPAEVTAIEQLVAHLRKLSPVETVPSAAHADGVDLAGPKRTRTRRPRMAAKPVPAPSLSPGISATAISFEADTKVQAAETVRVSTAKLDSLLRQAEEMIALKLAASEHAADLRGLEGAFESWRVRWARVRNGASPRRDTLAEGRSQIDEYIAWTNDFIVSLQKRIGVFARSALRHERSAAALVDELLDGAKRLVMLPCSTVLDQFPKQVRDLARDEGKEVELTIQGREVELDKRILEEIKAPLIHLVRNAVDHGIEEPAERVRRGKPSHSTLSIAVSQTEGNKVLISVSDDGRGIQAAKLRASAVKQGVLSAADVDRLSDEAALPLIFQSGLSTSPIVTEVSGRGLGMAIVRDKVTKLGGTISIESHEGEGTAFRILLPVTLATFKGILVEAGGQVFVIPVCSTERITRFDQKNIKTVEGRQTVELDGRALSFVQLADVLQLPKRTAGTAQQLIESIIIGTGEDRIAFAVDAVLNEQEVLVKNLGHPLRRVRNIAAATVLGSGTPVLILNAPDLLKSAVDAASTSRYAPTAPADDLPKVNRILVADDSVTSRMLIKNILETSGYAVETATDGLEALASLRNREFDLLVSDVEMPRMNGFELTTNVRADQKLNDIPVVLVTALSSREDKERGIDAGANAYIVKSSFDQSDLLSVISKLI